MEINKVSFNFKITTIIHQQQKTQKSIQLQKKQKSIQLFTLSKTEIDNFYY